LEEAESLTWALLDDQLSEVDSARLARLLEENQEARVRYIECVQLHVDLQDHFSPANSPQDKGAGVVVLPNLMPGLPGADACTPISE
jgi:hypothetical protein